MGPISRGEVHGDRGGKVAQFVLIERIQLSIIKVVTDCIDYQTHPADFGVDFTPEPDENRAVHLGMRPQAVSTMCYAKDRRPSASYTG